LGGAALALALAPDALAAQTRGEGFLFSPPSGSVTFSSGFAQARGSSDIFSYTRDLLTLEKGDFNSISLGLEYALRFNDNLDFFGSIGYASASERSEFRDWVDQDDLPIEQTTRFSRLPISAGARFYLMPRGRSIGSLAWLPSVMVPHVSAGVGVMRYRFRQVGDFVVDNGDIVSDDLESSGWAPLFHTGVGLDISLTPRLLLASEFRYTLSSAEMQGDFEGFENIDLSGAGATIGLKVRF
jgi:opacity protein-like surface antigen